MTLQKKIHFPPFPSLLITISVTIFYEQSILTNNDSKLNTIFPVTPHDPDEQPYREPALGCCRSALGELPAQTIRIFRSGTRAHLSEICGF